MTITYSVTKTLNVKYFKHTALYAYSTTLLYYIIRKKIMRQHSR